MCGLDKRERGGREDRIYYTLSVVDVGDVVGSMSLTYCGKEDWAETAVPEQKRSKYFDVKAQRSRTDGCILPLWRNGLEE